MNEKFTYLAVNLFSFLFPFLFSFYKPLRFHNKIKFAFRSLLLPASLFIIWDIIFTSQEIWQFNQSKTIGISLFGLPVEELLFFICIPYACLFTYNVICERTNWRIRYNYLKLIVPLVITGLLLTSLFNAEKIYTSVTLVLTSILLIYHYYIKRSMWLGQFFTAYLIILLPFFIVNGILTGSWIDEPVVIYNDAFNTGVRIGTIPVEDIFYGFSLLLSGTACFETLLKKHEASYNHFSI